MQETSSDFLVGEERMDLVNTVVNKYKELYGGEPTVIVRAPGRVNLIGEHTDYNDGFVLPMAIDRSFWIALSPREDTLVEIYSIDLDETDKFDAENPSHKPGHWGEYLRGIAWYLTKQGHKLTGWQGVASGNIPIGAGLSSSAGVELATARAFSAVSGIEWQAVEMAKVSQNTEIEWVGVNCGIMDQLISATGVAGHAVLIDCRSLALDTVPLPEGTSVIILDTSTRRGLVDSAYNERRSQCEEAAAYFGVTALRDVSLVEFKAKMSGMPLLAQKRAKHVISENERTLKAAEVMKSGDAQALGKLMNESHQSLEEDFEVSSDALNAIVAISQSRPECYGARMTGAGFGGCGVALVKAGQEGVFSSYVSEKFKEQTGLEAKLYICEAADGAKLINKEP
jgi:galactokinase